MSEKKKKAEPTAKDLLDLAAKLPQAEKDKLERVGFTCPTEGTDGIDDTEESVYGMVCVHCNQLALRFIGKNPPRVGARLDQVMWTQDNVMPNRRSPLCQWCGGTIRLSRSGTIMHPGAPDYGFVAIKKWEAEKAYAYDPKRAAELRARMMSQPTNLQGTSRSFDAQTGDALSHVEAVAQRGHTGMAGAEGTAPAQTAAPGHKTAVMEQISEISGLNALRERGGGEG